MAGSLPASPDARRAAGFDRGSAKPLLLAGSFLAALLLSLAILLHFHDRFWWAPDEGAYAHVAERVLAGEVLNGTVQDIHMGYVNFANALAFRLFGIDLASLRYPLVAMTLLQSALVFWLLASRGAAVAFSGALGMSALTFVQFLNPTAHWYALFICTLAVALLSAGWHRRRGGLELLGFVLVTLFLFRQLSGVFAAMGALTFLLLEEREARRGGRVVLARALALAMLAGLALYLHVKTEIATAVLFGGAPLLLLCFAGVKTRLADRDACRMVLGLGLGGLAALLPLLAYHLAQGSLASWWRDTVVAAVSLTELDFIAGPQYGQLSLQGLVQALRPASLAEAVNGFFWFALPLLPTLLGLLLLRALARGLPEGRGALPLVACFFALVSVHYQIPLYLFYATGLTLAGLLWLASAGGSLRLACVAACLGLCLVGVAYQAGQPLTRGWGGVIAGRTVPLQASGLARASLSIDGEDAALYRHLVGVIRAQSDSGDSILALPVNPELYFLAERRNPLRFFNAALGLGDGGGLAAAEAALAADPPRLVFYRPDDKYNTPPVRRLMAGLRDGYRLLEVRSGFEIYLRQD